MPVFLLQGDTMTTTPRVPLRPIEIVSEDTFTSLLVAREEVHRAQIQCEVAQGLIGVILERLSREENYGATPSSEPSPAAAGEPPAPRASSEGQSGSQAGTDERGSSSPHL